MAARELWVVVKREVRDMLAPGQAERRGAASPDSPPRINQRQDGTSTSLPPAVLPPAISRPPLDDADATSLALAPVATTTAASTTLVVAETSTSTPSSSATAEPSESDSGEISGAAKAGIVIGALAGILAIFVLVYLIFNSRRKKLARRRQQIEDDEKINGPFADSAEIRPVPPAKAPRLSLRPVTQFLPNFNAQHGERRQSRGIALTLNPVSNSALSRPTGGSAWERPTMASPHAPSARWAPSTTASASQRHPTQSQNRVSPILGDDEDDNRRQPSMVSNLTRKTSIRKDLPKPLDLTKPPSPLYAMPPSPSGTEFSMHSVAPGQSPGPSASAAAIAAAGGPSQSTVHRVQLDFKPTLQDEMGLYAGQLVRLLHEYDDGWALCIRLDRSQQGVVPRTCLSTRPVKPRPQQQQPGPPHANHSGNQRGGPPINPSFHFGHGNGGQGSSRPRSPAGGGGGGGGGAFPPVPLAKDDRYGGRRAPSPRLQHGGWRGDGYDDGEGDVSPAPGQAY
ncbi:hypothetical protein CHGG_04247 [Chaetomium globosum CBS 148.51]|uniref:SH3 domain-containing protein n=1 Tax=Chaetomium globosum (strain ATCC 6205 / CBS 148.51 / DSM 1962 / NBRC 6347 / NRRL 1970) TaxID=306901 RepID=Q2H1U9_CHAGB|nr:uncharacterized protein CHGG_04247 [Chaetomium globosum CBS 148.51]EAQ87628.1 hypothetical protein CHGG_04247 [Chaetomium globosum CBS 148.51]